LKLLPSTSSRSYPVKERKLSLAKIIGVVGFRRVRKHHRHSSCFSGNDKRAKVLPKALDYGFGAFLLVRLFCHFRHGTGRSVWLAGNAAEMTVARTSS
jgi:hypothetical protein